MLEYDGGLNRSGSFQQAALLGPAWNGHNADFSSTCSVQLLYKRYFKSYNYTSAYNSMQLTGVWSTTFANKKCTFSGFIDFWRGEKADNFVYNTFNDKSFFVNPTLALKWNF